MTPDDWFDVLRTALPGRAAPFAEDEKQALLDLARVGAHASERWVAPVSTYLAGVAIGEMPEASRGQALRQLVEAVERSVQADQ